MNAANQRRLTPVLAALAVALGAGVLLLWSGVGSGVHWTPPHALVALPVATSPNALPRAIPLQQFALVWQKPLFSPDRKPVAHAADGGSSLGDLSLTGIILTANLHMALLHDRNGDKQVRLQVGEALPDGSVTLVEVRARSALFDSPAGRTELKLPAGAPIDVGHPDAGAGGRAEQPGADDAQLAPDASPAQMRNAPGRGGTNSMRPVPFAPPTQRRGPDQTPASAVERLRESIQKRRAAKAAAANEGVR